MLDFDLFLYIFISKMHILIIYKQYEVIKTALHIVYIQFLNQFKKSRTYLKKVGHIGQLGTLIIIMNTFLQQTFILIDK